MDAIWNAQFGFAPAIALALLHSLWQGTLIAIAAALVLAACARRSAALRHTIGMGFLLAMVAVPAMDFIGFWQVSGADLNGGLLPAITPPVMGSIPGTFVQESGALAALLTIVWLLGVVLMLLRHFGGWRLVGSLEKTPYELLPADWQQRVSALQRALGISRTVVVRLGENIAAPFTARLIRPVIWLPLSLLARMPIEQVEALVAHELAHIRRLDWLWNGLQCVVESLLFFHPGAWWLSRRIRQEREHACDDLAVAACGNAIALAEALNTLERYRHPSPRLVLAAHGGSLMQRITRLLSGSDPDNPDSNSNRSKRWRLPAALAILLASGTLLATQVDVRGTFMPDLHFESTTVGVLRPGDSREIRANGIDKQRFYRADVDKAGKLTESYEENGKPHAIDKQVRAWVNEMTRLATTPPPPPPAPPAAPPAAPAPPAPPAKFDGTVELIGPPPPPPVAPLAPPAPPAISESASFKEILRLVAADQGVIRAMGNPLTVLPDSVDGNLRLSGINESQGEALLSFDLSGPNGRNKVTVAAERHDGAWQIESLRLRPVGM